MPIPLPFSPDVKSGSIFVSSGFGAPNHQGNISYSVDFNVGVDTKVLSQGNGTVVDLERNVPDSTEAIAPFRPVIEAGNPSYGKNGMGNFVTVRYDDGFYATYQHLQQNSIAVNEEKPVIPGQLLGEVGATGHIQGVHLHVTYGKEPITYTGDTAADDEIAADGTQAKNNNTAPVLFAADPDGILDAGAHYQGDNIEQISGPASGPSNATPAATTPPSAATGVNLLQNGSFEEGTDPGVYLSLNPGSKDITGWEVIRGGIDYVGTDWVSSDGSNRSLDLNGTPGVGGVAQMFTTTPGQQYHVSFDLAGHYSGLLQTIGVSAGGQSTTFSFQAGRNPKDLGWQEKTWEFTATDSQTKLEFSSLQTEYPYGGPALDDVVVTAANESPIPSQQPTPPDIPFFILGGQPPETSVDGASDDFLL